MRTRTLAPILAVILLTFPAAGAAEKKAIRLWQTETEPQTLAVLNHMAAEYEKTHPDVSIKIEGLANTLAWNHYIFTRILIASDELKTLPVGVQDLFAAAVVDWGLVMAAGMLITLPALAFFMAVQRHLVAGWGSGGLKG